MRSHHDMGGLPAGPIDQSEHKYEPWEKRTHAMLSLLARRGVMTVDELRRGIEALGAEEYDRL
ncbi:MAG: nitrile hydratase subunit beta, partial [Gemmataceae bacterium]|nr:nitrile hydratase subunit beta [Gemmataceae bacterium]